MTGYARAGAKGLVVCRHCGRVTAVSALARDGRCERCGAAVRQDAAPSSDAAWAWLIAAMFLYVPANTLPVMGTSGVIGVQESTIAGGIVSFWQAGSYGIAAIIFVASIAVPLTKFAAIGLLLWTTGKKVPWARRQRSKVYRAVEFIGYWSMLDVIVVAITSALVQFKALGVAEPRVGIAFFCAVVICTMLAAQSFDPRLIWVRHSKDIT